MNEEEKIFFVPGDLVTLKHPLKNKPVMYITKKETGFGSPSSKISGGTSLNMPYSKQEIFKGMRCRWFDTLGQLQEAVFSTKDLIKINPSNIK